MTPPATVAHYRIISKIGEGGMGEVWRATDTKLGLDVAIKVLPTAFAEDTDRMARFTREAIRVGDAPWTWLQSLEKRDQRSFVLSV
jgi:serine/threonine protein kinase